MSKSEIFSLTQAFIEENTACTEALAELKKGTEIRIILEGSIECACFYDGKRARLEKRLATNPDVEFHVLSEAIRRLTTLPGDNMAELGIEICREILAGNIEIRVISGALAIATKGYLSIIIAAGPDFMSFLAKHGFSSINKITQTIRNLSK